MTTPTPDLVRELRDASASGESSDWLRDIAARAADELERLRAQVAPARALAEACSRDWPSSPVTRRAVIEAADKLRTALDGAAPAQQAESPCACWAGRMCSRSAACAADVTAQQAPSLTVGERDGWTLAPDYRGYANLGTGQYVLNHSAAGEPAEVIISIATEEEKAGRAIGEERDNPSGHVLQPDAMAIRLRFASPAGLAALENEIRKMRETHGWAAPANPAAQGVDAPLGAIVNGRTHAERLEATGLECEAGKLTMCNDWVEFRRCFEHLADWAQARAALAQAPADRGTTGLEVQMKMQNAARVIASAAREELAALSHPQPANGQS